MAGSGGGVGNLADCKRVGLEAGASVRRDWSQSPVEPRLFLSDFLAK